jgi:hypothetical protein
MLMRNWKVVTLLLFFITGTQAQGLQDFFNTSDAFLKAHVADGLVDYKAIKEDDAQLKSLVGMIGTIQVAKTDKDNYQAYLINAYNLLVIQSVIANYPLKSPLDKAGFFDKTTHTVMGSPRTLNDIEHKLLRAVFPKESRFHFVLVCAGLGCPPLIGTAYRPETLEAQLQTQTEKALNDPQFIRVKKNKVGISQLFEWYTGDFTQGGIGLAQYINTYRKEPLPQKAKLSYYAYDWRLNEKK